MARSGRRPSVGLRTRALGVAAGLFVLGCGAGPESTTVVAPTSSSAGVATPGPTEPFAIIAGPLAPGRYRQAGFPPGVSFDLPQGWQAYFDDADGAYLGGPGGIEIGVNKPPKVVDPKTGKPVDTPADLAGFLAKSPAFDSAKSSAVTVAGMRATLVEATSKGEQDLLAYSSGNFHTVAGGRYRFYVFPLDGPDLLFMVIGPAGTFEPYLPMIETIVSSIAIGR